MEEPPAGGGASAPELISKRIRDLADWRGETYKAVVNLTFAKGASLRDPAGLFNASPEGSLRRAIDIRQGEVVDAAAFKALVLEAVAQNGAGKSAVSRQASS